MLRRIECGKEGEDLHACIVSDFSGIIDGVGEMGWIDKQASLRYPDNREYLGSLIGYPLANRACNTSYHIYVFPQRFPCRTPESMLSFLHESPMMASRLSSILPFLYCSSYPSRIPCQPPPHPPQSQSPVLTDQYANPYPQEINPQSNQLLAMMRFLEIRETWSGNGNGVKTLRGDCDLLVGA